ncbi:hypothetical protein DSO57_1022975 [Entomophthora muscae]|uniref:Uncharacterized protein n=1 Tax=Entomophthora muscae TaxID=34485 RepID=A0ACC2TRD8_9FUNG|nr:hypothetical protein DSO57_1022975 [Entomophthora muscae]
MKNAPSTFVAFMNEVFAPHIGKNALVYCDEIAMSYDAIYQLMLAKPGYRPYMLVIEGYRPYLSAIGGYRSYLLAIEAIGISAVHKKLKALSVSKASLYIKGVSQTIQHATSVAHMKYK